ncbi:MAG: RNA methyltransferase [Parachlamydiaceae bacterium]|nr:RNA methyltransferase [Parachlamydiaceae bacterium]
MNQNRTPILLSSLQNPNVKDIIHLRERHERDRTGTFIIEGYREILRATDANWKINAIFVCPELFLGTNEPALIQRINARGAQQYTCTQKVFEKISYRDRPDGVIAIATQKKMGLSDLDYIFKTGKPPLLVVAEAIEKPGNLGTILRSSDAVGVDALIVCDRCTDIYNPNVVRASVGTLFTVPTVEAKGEETLEWLKKHGVYILAATPQADKEFTEVDVSGPVAIAVGTEQLGLSKRWMEQAHLQVSIPMNGVADSLNVAMATTLLLYEAHRQRKKTNKKI